MPRYLSKGNENIDLQMFIAALFVIVPNLKQPNYSSTGD